MQYFGDKSPVQLREAELYSRTMMRKERLDPNFVRKQGGNRKRISPFFCHQRPKDGDRSSH
jgi:hypothetical protein